MHFVEYRELHGDQWQVLEQLLRVGPMAGVFEVEENDRQTMGAVTGKTN
jgi:hypothetical protein